MIQAHSKRTWGANAHDDFVRAIVLQGLACKEHAQTCLLGTLLSWLLVPEPMMT